MLARVPAAVFTDSKRRVTIPLRSVWRVNGRFPELSVPPRPVMVVKRFKLLVNSLGRVSSKVTPGGQGMRLRSSRVTIETVLILEELKDEGFTGGIKAGKVA